MTESMANDGATPNATECLKWANLLFAECEHLLGITDQGESFAQSKHIADLTHEEKELLFTCMQEAQRFINLSLVA
jgi:hypothetical protein